MLSKIFMFITSLCLSEVGFCQLNQDSIKHRQDSLAAIAAKVKQDSIRHKHDSLIAVAAKAKQDSIKHKHDSLVAIAAKAKQDLIKYIHDSLVTIAAKTKQDLIKHRHDSLAEVRARRDSIKHRHDSLDAVAAISRTPNYDSVAGTDPRGKHDPLRKKKKEYYDSLVVVYLATIKKQENDLDSAKNTQIRFITGVGILTLAVIFLLFKFRQTETKNKSRKQTIDTYLGYNNNLTNLLMKRGFLDPRANYEAKSIYGKTEELINKFIPGDDRKRMNDELEDMKNQMKKSGSDANQKTTFVSYRTNLPSSYIKSEILISAGPRKNTLSNDTELGEDVAGSIAVPNHTYFWLLDGTSDSYKDAIRKSDNNFEEHHLFSSRLLAQSIGYFIQKKIIQYTSEQKALNQLLIDARIEVEQEWEKRLNNDQSGRRESIIADFKKGYQIICSTTVIIGCLSDDGQFYALRAGDSKVLPFKKSGDELELDGNFKFASDPTVENDRITFGLIFDENENKLKIIQNENELKWLSQSTTDIQCVFAFTDGIGRNTEALLTSGNPGIVEIIRQNIGSISQETQDDKTLIILERITNNA